MMAQMGAITAYLNSSNPVPVLRIFIWGSIVSAGLVFLYCVWYFSACDPFLNWLWCYLCFSIVTMMANQMLMPVGMVLGISRDGIESVIMYTAWMLFLLR